MSIAFVMWCSFLGNVDPNSCYGKYDRVEETETIETAVKDMDGVKKIKRKNFRLHAMKTPEIMQVAIA
jgi:hypothetical protein